MVVKWQIHSINLLFWYFGFFNSRLHWIISSSDNNQAKAMSYFIPGLKLKWMFSHYCSSIKLPFSTLLVSLGTSECSTGSYVCDINANCTKTDDSYICACKGYTGDGHSFNSRRKFLTNKKKLFPLKLRNLMFFSLSCNVLAINFCSQMSMSVAMATMFAMSIWTVTTQMVLIFVPAKKDTLEMDSHVKVNKSSPHYLKHTALLISYRPWKLAHIFEDCFHAPLSYFY